MANKTISELPYGDIPVLGTDEVLISRDGVSVNRIRVSDLLQESVPGKFLLTSNVTTDSSIDNTYLGNNTSSPYVVTIAPFSIVEGLILQQLSSGTVAIASGDAAVTFVGTPTMVTSAPGQQISIVPTPIVNRYIVKLG